jgi:hypothetical protein
MILFGPLVVFTDAEFKAWVETNMEPNSCIHTELWPATNCKSVGQAIVSNRPEIIFSFRQVTAQLVGRFVDPGGGTRGFSVPRWYRDYVSLQVIN